MGERLGAKQLLEHQPHSLAATSVMEEDKEAEAKNQQTLLLDIADSAVTISWMTLSIFCVGMFLTLLRPDPTVVVCLFGIYGSQHLNFRSLKVFVAFLTLSIGTDVVWILVGSELGQSVDLETFEFQDIFELSRTAQIALMLTALNLVYKIILIPLCIRIIPSIIKYRESMLDEENTTSDGAAQSSGSLAAKDGI